jgi:hypothetical protein
MSTQQNIIGPLDYRKCANSNEHESLLKDIIDKVNEAVVNAGSAKNTVVQTDVKFEKFKTGVEGDFKLVAEKIKNINEKIENVETSVSGIATTNDLSEQNKILIDSMMKIFSEKGTTKRGWITFAGIILVALIGLVPFIYGSMNAAKSDKLEIILKKVEALEAKNGQDN